MRSVLFQVVWAALVALNPAGVHAQSAGSAKKALEAIVKRDFKHAVALVRAVDDPNYADRSGATLLMCAAEMGAEEVCQALLDKGADPDLRSANGTTALYIAAQNGYTDVVRLLLDKGASTDLRPDNGATSKRPSGLKEIKKVPEEGSNTLLSAALHKFLYFIRLLRYRS
ncbi:MAG: ankyrin repeat domain-containing protein [Bacteroidales bacterium]|nr:ankyrin repeat domain-containing protein [Bacteroidales bacterium]